MDVDDSPGLRIGDLAVASGVSIRTVRYYDQIGLLTPSRRNPAGHRLYSDADVRRLYRICLLRRTGLSLAQIGQALDEPGWDLHQAMRTHLKLLDHHQAATAAMSRRLNTMLDTSSAAGLPSTTELLQTMEDMTVLDDIVQRRISILVYDDIPAAHAWLVRVFGLGAGELAYDEQGRCVHGELRAGDGMIWLHQVSPHFGLASPGPSAPRPPPQPSWSTTSITTTPTPPPKAPTSSTSPPTSPTATANTAPATPRAASGPS